jgi:CDP-glycerol glycerophosphotransferase (TagB/SpsB family)
MVREAAVSVYLLVFRVLFMIFRLCPQKEKTTFVASFGDNVLYTLRALEKQADRTVVVLKTSRCKVDFSGNPGRLVLNFEPVHLVDWVRSVYHLATSSHIFVDNYFGFLAAAPFRPNVACIQLWHAAGAIKQFGLKDPSIKNRSPRALKRFKKVYGQFSHFVVGSEKMASIFCESFGTTGDRMLRTGVPRTDFFFDETAMQAASGAIRKEIPAIRGKKVILYAPTYRDDELHVSGIELDLGNMYAELKGEYVLLLRLHPAVRVDFSNTYPDFVVDVSHYPNVNDLLAATDILITDYSSIPFEFSLLERPMIFFAYDLEKYAESRGFWEPYEQLVPGPVVHNTEEILEVIRNGAYDFERIRTFAHEWNEYATGKASEQLVAALYSQEKEPQRSF